MVPKGLMDKALAFATDSERPLREMCQSLFHYGRLHDCVESPVNPGHSTIMRHKAGKAQQELDDYVCEFFTAAGSTAVCRIIVEYVGSLRVLELVRDHVVAANLSWSAPYRTHYNINGGVVICYMWVKCL